MKVVANEILPAVVNNLYIPHGSDESQTAYDRDIISTILYIPHGSDESEGDGKIFTKLGQLYIPHGSDERVVVEGLADPTEMSLYPT